MSANTNLNAAQTAKKDEFYTQLPDIERELRHYKGHFQGKVVYCNCDDPRVSNFFHYFSYNFEALGLKRLITTCYMNQSRDLFSRHDSEQSIWLEYEGDKDGNKVPDPDEIGTFPLKEDGDFRSAECIELLKQADIVVTNPPFSLFRRYVAQLIKYGKKFVIIGNFNAVTYKEIFPLIQDGELWLGMSPRGMSFRVPDGHYVQTNACWFTNLDIPKRHEDLILHKRYSPEEYPKYDNYDAINVNRTNEIPVNWGGLMGVPISFLDKHNPDQFEIMGIARSWNDSVQTHKYYNDFVEVRPDGSKTGMTGTKANGYPVLPGYKKGKNYLLRGDEVVHTAYGRIFIRNRNPKT